MNGIVAETCAWCGSADDVFEVTYFDDDGNRCSERICAGCKGTLVRRRARRATRPERAKVTIRMRVAGAILVVVSLAVFLLGVFAAVQSFFG